MNSGESCGRNLETGKNFGMQTMEQSLEILYKKGLIDYQTALKSARNPSLLEEKLGFCGRGGV